MKRVFDGTDHYDRCDRFGNDAYKVSALLYFSRGETHAEIHTVFGKGAACRRIRAVSRLLFKECKYFYGQPRPARTDRNYSRRRSAFMETADAFIHCGRDGLLYAACADGFLKI